MGYTSTTLRHLRIEHKELEGEVEGDFRFLLRVSNELTSFVSPGLSTISFRTSKQFSVFRVVYFMCLKITVSWNTSEGRVSKNQEVSGQSLWLEICVGLSTDWNQKIWTKNCTFSDRLKSVACLSFVAAAR